jgi:hypothetical protein
MTTRPDTNSVLHQVLQWQPQLKWGMSHIRTRNRETFGHDFVTHQFAADLSIALARKE